MEARLQVALVLFTLLEPLAQAGQLVAQLGKLCQAELPFGQMLCDAGLRFRGLVVHFLHKTFGGCVVFSQKGSPGLFQTPARIGQQCIGFATSQ